MSSEDLKDVHFLQSHEAGNTASDTGSSGTGSGSASNMVVAVRLRPLSLVEEMNGQSRCCRALGNTMVQIRKAGVMNAVLKTQMQDTIHDFAFDHVFDENTDQAFVYEEILKNKLPNFLRGENVTVFAYGATGKAAHFLP